MYLYSETLLGQTSVADKQEGSVRYFLLKHPPKKKQTKKIYSENKKSFLSGSTENILWEMHVTVG